MIYPEEAAAFKQSCIRDQMIGTLVIGIVTFAVAIFVSIVLGGIGGYIFLFVIFSFMFISPMISFSAAKHWEAKVIDGNEVVETISIAIPRFGASAQEKGFQSAGYGRSAWGFMLLEFFISMIGYVFALVGMFGQNLRNIFRIKRLDNQHFAAAVDLAIKHQEGVSLGVVRQHLGGVSLRPLIRGLEPMPGIMVMERQHGAVLYATQDFCKEFTAFRGKLIKG